MAETPVQQAIRARLSRQPTISKRRLAAQIGVKPDTLTGWERGRRPHGYQFVKMAPVLEVPVDELRRTATNGKAEGLPDDVSTTLRRVADLADVVPAIKELGERAPDLIAAIEDAVERARQFKL